MQKRIELIVALIETDLRLPVTPNKVAPLVNLSPSRLRHVFKKETGMSLKRYQRQLRMKKARELLEGSFLTVKEIMSETGILDRNYFARTFRQTYGATPTQHRRLVAEQGQAEQQSSAAS